MRSSGFLQGLAAVCIAATASAVSGQNTAIQLFGPVNVRNSTQGTSYGDKANVFNSTILNLNCPANIQATISSSSDGTGNVLVDNYISLGVGGATPVDICKNGTSENGGQQNCFNTSYESEAGNGGLNGRDPDSYASTGGVPPLDISSYLSPGAVQAQIGTVDTGYILTSSTLYLVTNCASTGVSGPGQITGNPISSSNPTGQQLTQNYSFNSTNNQQVQFTYDLSVAQNAGTLAITDGSTPSTGDTPLNPLTFQSTYLNGTSFATANCLTHVGELYNGSPACKLYTLTCQVGTNSNQSGVLCPVSQQRNEVFQEVFDGPIFTLPDIPGTDGLTFHQGVGFLEAKEGWNGGSCVFDSASSIASLLCPQNVLTNFSGPGAYRSGGSGQAPNSTFVTVAPVPEDLTAVSVTGQQPGYWINSHSATVNFVSTPPAIASTNSFVAAPIQSLTYGISSASSVPQPPAPVSGDITLENNACPAPGGGNPPATVFTPPAQDISVSADGQYLLRYFAQDCAGTQELKFTQSGGSWSTSFYTFPINVDTVAPVVLSGPTLSPAPSTNGGVANSYLMGQKVTATYRCTDDRSGIVKCGASTYAPGTTLDTGNINSPVDTSKAGPATYTVNAVDAAGNLATASVNYLVVAAPPVNLGILKVAASAVKHNAQLTYGITAANLGKQTASAVVVTDPLPAGVTFVRAAAQQLTCNNGKCSNTASCTFASNTVSCTAPSMTLLNPMLVEITVSVQASAGTKIKNTATVSSSNPDSSPGNNQSTAITLVY
jgi:uncharacterized repeat protein (TIGR01451 family)